MLKFSKQIALLMSVLFIAACSASGGNTSSQHHPMSEEITFVDGLEIKVRYKPSSLESAYAISNQPEKYSIKIAARAVEQVTQCEVPLANVSFGKTVYVDGSVGYTLDLNC